MPNYEIIEYILPAHWVSSLINGDDSGLENDDLAAIDKLVTEVVKDCGNACFNTYPDDESFFVTYHDAHHFGVLAADCLTYYILKEVTK